MLDFKSLDSGVGTFPQPQHRFAHIHIYIVGLLPKSHEHRYLFTIIDRSTFWAKAIPMQCVTSASCISALLSVWIARCEVAYQLLDIFLLLGALEILQNDKGSEFTACVITELKLLWPDLVMVHGKPRHPQSQGSVEQANCDIKDMLVACEDDLLAVITEETTSDEPPAVEPVTAKPPAVEPVTAEPPAVEPVTAEPPAVEQVTPEPPAVEQVTALGVLCTTVIRVTAEPPAVEPTSPLSVRQKNITSQRKRACEAQLSQAGRMVKRSRRIMDRGNVGNNVTIPIPMVDRGRGNPRNIMGIIMDIDENDNYTIAVKSGILSGKYTRNQF
ncbi:uncharacterized protein [Palaemon carinicauda]|uniref:uncharacterized protein n=1 Tax=Palaemon carinicauda TaxID=392227 RepID=UPI0035B66D5C